MKRPKMHKDVEFHVECPDGSIRILKTFDEAAGLALTLAAGDGEAHFIDVQIASRAGARWWGGGDAVERYLEDQGATCFERISVRAESLGMVH